MPGPIGDAVGAPGRQRGAALLLLLALLVLGATGLFLAARPENGYRQKAQRERTDAMQAAKEELIGFAVHYDQLYPASSTGPGHFPCPDASGNGNPNTPCGPNAIGRLPRTAPSASRVLWFGDHGAGTGRGLWYALANGFRDNPPGQKVNSNAVGTLTVNGVAGAIAVIVEPGDAMPGQNRPGNSYTDYLEGANPGAGTYTSVGNDRVLAIHARELIPLAGERVAAEVIPLLRQYRAGCGYYPAPVPFADPNGVTSFDSATSGSVFEGLFPADTAYPTDWGSGCAPPLALPGWLIANGWLRHAYYAIAPSDPCSAGIDCLTVNNGPTSDDDRQALLLLPGIALAGQERTGAGAGRSDYFEGENATAADGRFESGRGSATFNDQIFVVD